MSKGQGYFILAVLFAVLVAVFGVQNPGSVSIKLLFWQFDTVSKVLLILVSTAVGALVVVLLGLFWSIGKMVRVRRLESEIRELRNKLGDSSGAAALSGEYGDATAGPAGAGSKVTNVSTDPVNMSVSEGDSAEGMKHEKEG